MSVQMLPVARPDSTLRRLYLTVLALPSSLCRQQVFAQVSVYSVHLTGCFHDSPPLEEIILELISYLMMINCM